MRVGVKAEVTSIGIEIYVGHLYSQGEVEMAVIKEAVKKLKWERPLALMA